jgi:hypothetical protein
MSVMLTYGQLRLAQKDGGPPTTLAAGSVPGESGVSNKKKHASRRDFPPPSSSHKQAAAMPLPTTTSIRSLSPWERQQQRLDVELDRKPLICRRC